MKRKHYFFFLVVALCVSMVGVVLLSLEYTRAYVFLVVGVGIKFLTVVCYLLDEIRKQQTDQEDS